MSPLVKRLLLGVLGLVIVVFGGAAGYYVIGDGRWQFWDCMYMTVISVTTVGYGETLVNPPMETVQYARAFTIVLLLFGTGSIVYFASTITAFIVEGDLKNVLFASRLKKRMKRMKDHVVVCGAGSTGRNVIEELLKTNVPVVAIDLDEHVLKEIADDFPKAEYSYLVGDATDDDLMATVNLVSARGLVAALASDKDNLYLAVSGRQTNPGMRIVARCAELSHIEKLKRAGADAVVSPNYIGGMRMVSEMVRPSVVKFLDDMLRDKRAAYRIEDVTINASTDLGSTLKDARILERFGMNVLALRPSESGTWTYNPDGDEKIIPGMTLVVLGSADQVAALRKQVS
ncbi:MAG: potassium channel protein [Deltaproteobacteria bacterium]|nr:potassium channel protein [Deltaproteobacteria bacterium]